MRIVQYATSGLLLFLLFDLAAPVDAFTPPAVPPSPVVHHHAADRLMSKFGPPTTVSTSSLRSRTTTLYASRRRETFSWLRRVLVAGMLGISTQRPGDAMATVDVLEAATADSSSTGAGNVIVLTVENLDGIEGNTGTVKIQMQPSWAPKGVERFEELSKIGFFNECRVFRVLPGFVVQFGINGNPKVQSEWRDSKIRDDPVKVSNERGTVVFATAGPNTRTTQVFINTRPEGNTFLDKQGFSPIGRVIEGMDVVDRMYGGYGEGQPAGKGPSQPKIQSQGNAYLKQEFPKLSYIARADLA
jgi:peptidyl-prolyl cis-trans isomerase A (cyclophilin A)